MTVESVLLDILREQRISGNFCDIQLAVAEQTSWIHAAIICPLSPYIESCYGNIRRRCSDASRNILQPIKIKLTGKVAHDCFDCLQKLLDLIYGIKTSICKEHLSHLLSYCEVLKLPNAFTALMNDAVGVTESDVIKTEPFENPPLGDDDFDNDNDDDLKIVNDNKVSTIGKTYDCLGCDYKCYKFLNLLNHLRRTGHGGNACSLCRAELRNSDELEEHFLLHENPKPFFCEYCNMRFRSRSLLRQHIPGHISEKPYECPHCQKAFKRKNGLNCHLATHTNERKHLCDECGFSTIHARILRAHKLGHSGNLFKCPYPNCVHVCTRKENMKQHHLTHTNEKPFVCELCGVKFKQRKSLKRHSLMHGESDRNRFCSHCPFKTWRDDNLKAHILRQHPEKVSKSVMKRISEKIMKSESENPGESLQMKS